MTLPTKRNLVGWVRHPSRIWQLAAFAVGYTAALKPVYDFDVDWHLAAGRWMLEHRQFITIDPFSFTFGGKPWLSITWLHEILSWLLFKWGGYVLLVIVFPVLAGLTAAALFTATVMVIEKSCSDQELKDSPTRKLFALLGIMSVSLCVQFRWSHRPESWTYLLGSLLILLLLRYLIKPTRSIFLVPAIQLIWVNTHGIFVLGPAMVGLVLILVTIRVSLSGRRESPRFYTLKHIRQLSLALTGTVLVCLINPRGITGALWPIHLLSVLESKVFGAMIPEAIPPFGQGQWGLDSHALAGAMILYAVGLIVWGIHLFRSSDRGTERDQVMLLFGTLLFLATAYTATTARRNIPLVILWVCPIALASLWRLLKSQAAIGLIGVITIIAGVFLGVPAIKEKAQFFTSGFRNLERTPESCARFIEQYRLFSPGFTTVSEANYLTNRLFGQFRPYIDSRFAEVYDEQHFHRYMDILAAPPLIESEVEKWRIDHLIVGHHLPLACGLVQYLAGHPERWQPVHLDEMTAIFLRRGAATTAEWADEAEKKLSESIGAILSNGTNLSRESSDRLTGYGRALALTGHLRESHACFREACQRDPKDYEAAAGLCNVTWMLCENQNDQSRCASEALEVCRKAMNLEPRALPAIFATAMTSRAAGDVAAAIDLFRRALRIDPISYEASMGLADTLAGSGIARDDRSLMFESVSEFSHAARLRPYNPEPWYSQGVVLERLSLPEDAAIAYRQGLARNPSPLLRERIESRLNSIGLGGVQDESSSTKTD